MAKRLPLLLLLLVLVVASALAARSPLTCFGLLVPKDAGSQPVLVGMAYGVGPRHRLDVYAPDARGPRGRWSYSSTVAAGIGAGVRTMPL